MDTERDKFLTEAIGECWHDWKVVETYFFEEFGRDVSVFECSKCGDFISGGDFETPYQINFSTWGSFGKLWEWVQKKEWWSDFIVEMMGCHYDPVNLIMHIHPDRFADALYEFLREYK